VFFQLPFCEDKEFSKIGNIFFIPPVVKNWKLFLGKKHLGFHATFIACHPCHCMENAKRFVLV
jgi:hypothetical protein